MKGLPIILVLALAGLVAIAALIRLAQREPEQMEMGRENNRVATPVVDAEPAPPIGIPAPKPVPAPLPVPANMKSVLDSLATAFRAGDKKGIQKALDALLDQIVPPPVSDGENAALIYLKAFEKLSAPTPDEKQALAALTKGSELTDAQRTALKACVEKNREALELIRDAAARPRCRFDVDYAEGFGADATHVEALLEIPLLLQAASLSAEGPAKADLALLAAAAAGATKDEPLFESQIVVDDGLRTAVLMLQDALRGEAGREALERVSKVFRPETLRSGYARGMLGEIYVAGSILMEAAAPTPRHVESFIRYAETMSAYADSVAQPYHRIRKRLQELDRLAALAKTDAPVRMPWTIPSMENEAGGIADAEARVGAARVAAEIELYRLENGTLPPSVEKLTAGLPADPFTGRPFTYRRQGSGFVLAGPGQDGNEQIYFTRE